MVLLPGRTSGELAAGALARVVSVGGTNATLTQLDATAVARTFVVRAADLTAVAPEASRALVRVGGDLWLLVQVRRPLPRTAAPGEGPPCGAFVTFADGSAEAHVVRAHASSSSLSRLP